MFAIAGGAVCDPYHIDIGFWAEVRNQSDIHNIYCLTSNYQVNFANLDYSQKAGLRPAMLAIAVSVRQGNLFCLDFTYGAL